MTAGEEIGNFVVGLSVKYSSAAPVPAPAPAPAPTPAPTPAPFPHPAHARNFIALSLTLLSFV